VALKSILLEQKTQFTLTVNVVLKGGVIQIAEYLPET
jgi:hypothetical protein